MTQEDIEQVIKDQPKIWVENLEKGKGKEKEKETVPEKDKEEDTKTDKGKASLSEKQPSIIDTRSSLRKKRKSSKLTYHTVLHDDDFENITDRFCDNMSKPITTITTA